MSLENTALLAFVTGLYGAMALPVFNHVRAELRMRNLRADALLLEDLQSVRASVSVTRNLQRSGWKSVKDRITKSYGNLQGGATLSDIMYALWLEVRCATITTALFVSALYVYRFTVCVAVQLHAKAQADMTL